MTENLSHAIGSMSTTVIILIYAVLMAALFGAFMIQKKNRNMKIIKGISILATTAIVMLTSALVFQPTNTVLFIIGGVYLVLSVVDTQVKKLGV